MDSHLFYVNTKVSIFIQVIDLDNQEATQCFLSATPFIKKRKSLLINETTQLPSLVKSEELVLQNLIVFTCVCKKATKTFDEILHE